MNINIFVPIDSVYMTQVQIFHGQFEICSATQAVAQAAAWGFKNVKPEPWATGSPVGAS
jgi:hypothetical protein